MKTPKGALAGVFVALLFAAALVGSCGVLLESALRAHAPVSRYDKGDAVVTGSQSVSVNMKRAGSDPETQSRPLVERARVPAAAAERLRSVPGVKAVVADVSFPVLAGQGVTVTGHGWDSAALGSSRLTAGRAPQGPNEVVLDAATASRAKAGPGATIALQTVGTPQPFRVVGVASAGGAFFAPQAAAVLSGHPGQADALVVVGKAGAGALKKAAPGLKVRTGAARGDAEDLSVAAARPDMIEIGASLGALSLMTALVVVGGLIALSVRERAREFALLRAVGATPWQVRGRIIRETLRIAVPAGVLGGVVSLGLGAAMHGAMKAKDVLPDGFGLSISPLPALAALLVTVLAATLSAFFASLRTTRIRPVEALGEASIDPPSLPLWRRITGGVFLVLGISALGTSVTATGPTASSSLGGMVIAFIVATAFLGPLLAGRGSRILGRVTRTLSPVSGKLAAENSGAAALRLGAVVTPVALAIAFAGVQLFVQTTTVDATEVQAAKGTRADQVVVSAGPGLPEGVLQNLRSTPGVTAATAAKPTTVVMTVKELGERNLRSLNGQGVTPDGIDQTLDPGVSKGRLGDLRGTTVALSRDVAGGLKVGSLKTLWLGDGTQIKPRVVAIYDRGLGFGDVLLPHDLVAAHASSPLSDHVLVRGGANLRPAVAPYAGATVISTSAFGAEQSRDLRLQGFLSYVVVLAISGFIVIGVVTTLSLATVSRRRELTLLRLVGATRRQVLRMLRLEAFIVLGIGVAVGAVISGVTLMAYAMVVTGLPLPSIPPLTCAAVLLLVTVPGAAAMLLPARTMMRRI
ncbi:ABC transporter permease [Actinomadura barringtoniae]|uniref:ABC transporter permease n=1 Tax=Actinomadura barringtoniae TaxID=1427535 RepID=A0A939PHT2_9ACTN|nr:ABC transporter permease [Actinomadura barringtoniae]MBO2452705.1 ABC transporter permease [Actinomadura barringtoniae]